MSDSIGSGRRQIVIGGVLAVVAVVVVLLFLRNCRPTVAVQAPAFDYFVAKAAELGNDPKRIVAYVRDQMRTLAYRGDVKGALGALWNGAASPEEKLALAQALLKAAGSAGVVTLDDVCPTRDKKLDSPAAVQLVIVHRIDTAEQPTDVVVYEGPPGALVGDVHSVEMGVNGKTRVTIRAEGAAPMDIVIPDGAEGESLVFKWHLPGGPQGAEVSAVRELWHRGNRTGAAAANAGDRHDFTVLPCAIGAYVREKEPVILKQRGRDGAMEAPAYLALLDFALVSDAQTAEIEKQMQLVAQRDEPRVLIWSRYKAADLPGGYATALDARIDRVDFGGERMAAYRATQTRSLLEAGLMAQFVEHAGGLPATSAFSVFSMLKADMPTTVGQRLTQIRDALRSLQEERSFESVATFAVQPADSTVAAAPKIEARWAADGITTRPAGNSSGTAGVSTFKTVEEAALAVETGLLSADGGARVLPDYVLDVRLERKPISLVQPGARFILQWLEEGTPTDQQIRILQAGGGLEYQWRVQTGVLPVAGTREISAAALNNATAHNPWYRAGSSMQADATSFALSRKVYRSINAGKAISVQMLGALGTKSDAAATRPVESTEALTPGTPESIQATINGKSETLKILPATFRGKAMALLDDPAFPVGMAQAIKSVVTAIRCRLMDTHDQPIAGARVEVLSRDQSAQVISEGGPSAPDGFLLLAPPDQGDAFGKVTLQVLFLDGSTKKMDVDLSAPGLSTVTIKVDRPAMKLIYLARNDRRQLDGLKVSEEIKRQARRDLEAGRLVVIPAGEVPDGFMTHIAYFVCDLQSGDCVGVMETGVAGAATWYAAAAPSAPAPVVVTIAPVTAPAATAPDAMQEAAAPPADAVPTVWQPSWQAWHQTQIQPLALSPELLDPQTLRALRAWGQVTDVAGAFADTPDAKLAETLGTLLKLPTLGSSGAAAKPAFQIGFISTSRFLAQELEKPHAP